MGAEQGPLMTLRPRKIVAVLGVSLLAAAAGSCGDDKEGFQPPSKRGSEITPEHCRYSPDNPQPLASEDPPEVYVWGFCQVPPEDPAGIFSKPKYKKELQIAKVDNGDRLEVLCTKESEEIRDHNKKESVTWLRVKLPEDKGALIGYISVVNVGFSIPANVSDCQ